MLMFYFSTTLSRIICENLSYYDNDSGKMLQVSFLFCFFFVADTYHYLELLFPWSLDNKLMIEFI